MKYAKVAKENNLSISTYKTGRRYSLLYYSDLSLIDFHGQDEEWLHNELKKDKNMLIIRNRDIDGLPVKIKYAGTKYSVVEK